MEFKPFEINIGYDERVTSYSNGMRGKIPKADVLEWLHENVGKDRWQYDWKFADEPNSSTYRTIDYIDFIREVNKMPKTNHGGTFYFDSEEDRLLFCLKWIANGVEQPIMWHPV